MGLTALVAALEGGLRPTSSPLPFCRPMGLAALVAALGGPELSKPKNVTMSNWANRQLSDKQVVWTVQCVDMAGVRRADRQSEIRQSDAGRIQHDAEQSQQQLSPHMAHEMSNV